MHAALLSRLIDHAPLFPPASMGLPEALAEDRAARASEYAWMLDRFVCPASQLARLPADMPPVSVVLDQELTAPADAVEVRLTQPRPDSTELLLAARTLRSLSDEVYFELVLGESWRDSAPAAIGAIAAVGGRVKLLLAGDPAPSAEQVALVLVACHRAGAAMKATAGLHRALARPGRHGFLNMLCAALLAHARDCPAAELEAVLGVERVEELPLDEFDAADAAGTRERLFKGFGSCSWREPVADLRELGLVR